MDEKKDNIVDSALEAGKNMSKVQVLNETLRENIVDVPRHIIVTNKNVLIASLEGYYLRPTRKKGRKDFSEISSFNAYVNKHKVEGETVITADEEDSSIECVFNSHSEFPGWGDFRSVLLLQKSDQWKAWIGSAKKMFSQIAFADFIEDNRVDFMAGETEDGTKNISALELMALVVSLQESRKSVISSSVNRHDGTYNFTATDEKDNKKTQIKVPEKATLAIPVYKGGDVFQFDIRLRYRTDDGSVKFYYIIDQKDQIIRTAFKKMRDRVEKGNPGGKEGEKYAGTNIQVWA
jgi:uncharacterized protein YfdQ (DUF2303 family)